MKVTVVGPGALGCMFTTRLMQGGIDVTLVDYKSERAERLGDSGITMTTDGDDFRISPRVKLSIPRKQDLIIVLTKAYRTSTIALPQNVPVLTLQNGLGNVDKLCEQVGSAHVIAGTTSEACMLLAENHVRYVAPGISRFGAWTTCSIEPAKKVFEEAGFAYEITESPGQAIWEKTIVSAGINPLTALLDVPNGRLLELEGVRQLLRDLVVEATKVAAMEGYRFPYSLVERAEFICRETGENVSSMLQDVRAKRQTEIEEICGEILRRGQIASLLTPRTHVIYQLIKGLEAR